MSRFIIPILLAIVAVWGCGQESNSPCILQATFDRCSFVFRKDSTYQWVTGSGLGIFTEEGTYQLKDSFIILDRIGFDNVIKTRFLLIRSGLPWADVEGKFVIQVNKDGRSIGSQYVFKVYIDDRKKW